MSDQTRAEQAVKSLQGKAEPFPWWSPDDVKGKIRLHISVPTYVNTISLNMDASLKSALNTSMHRDNLEVDFNFTGGDSLIPRVRDKMAAHFLNSNSEWQLQIDDDIVFPYGMGPELARYYANWMSPEIFRAFMLEGIFQAALSMNAIDEILRSGIKDDKKIVGGLYFWRGGVQNLNEAASLLPPSDDGSFEIEFKLTPDNYISTDRLATGFLLIHRSVYEEVEKAFPELLYDLPQNIPNKPTCAFYSPVVTKEVWPTGARKKGPLRFYRSEDYAFAWRAKQVGFDPCLNMNILLGHIGTHIYSWFDRPPLQKIMLDTLSHPQHSIEKMVQGKGQ